MLIVFFLHNSKQFLKSIDEKSGKSLMLRYTLEHSKVIKAFR